MHAIYNYMSVTFFYSNHQSVTSMCLSIYTHTNNLCVCVVFACVFRGAHAHVHEQSLE